MKVKYRGGYYTLSFRDKIRYDKKKVLLFIKRIKRLFDRVLNYNKNLWVILAIVIVFMLIIIPIGINAKKYDSVIDGIWDFRNTIFTTIVISFFVNTITSEKRRKNNLKQQYEIYRSIEYYTENTIRKLLKMIGYTWECSIFIDNENSDCFSERLCKIEEYDWDMSDSDAKEQMIYLIQNYMNKLSYELSKMNRSEVVGIDKEYDPKEVLGYFEEYLLKLKNKKESEFTPDFVRDYIVMIMRLIIPVIAAYRRPWRWDLKNDREMRKLLKEKAAYKEGCYDRLGDYDLPEIKKIQNN